jgi:5'-3' exonuclease
MGIPSYFSYIIKNHSNIIRNLDFHRNKQKTIFNHLFIDANSIIYDAYHSLVKENAIDKMTKEEIENRIIDTVIVSIQKYILYIKPTDTIFIGFDGVAPFAKMEQQRTRRYKSEFLSKMSFKNGSIQAPKSIWNTTSITPGTNFMNLLSKRIIYEFALKEQKYAVKQIIVTPSVDPGEGEHKIYDHIRNNMTKQDIVAIYGLDADLIMLSIFQLVYCKNIYVFREAPEFANSVKVNEVSVKLPLFLNIDLLGHSILSEMDCKYSTYDRVNDYVFLCFLLGNDFLPHFPALNIRTYGIQILIDTYRKCIGNREDRYLISKDRKIQWRNVRILLEEIAKHEKEYILNEYSLRDKMENRKYEQTTEKEKEDMLNNVPVIFRAEEKYISPNDLNWEDRYYKILLHETRETANLKNICNNYLEGLEWVYKYYTHGCPDWKWKYNYHYPPLLVDLIHYIPHYETEFILENNSKPFSPYTQLSYVLPVSQFELLPNKISSYLLTNFSSLYSSKLEFKWAFCKFFWESHVDCKPIPLDILEKWDKQFIQINV